MTARTLYDKIWADHLVDEAEDGTSLIYIDRHRVHEVTSPQAFEGLRMTGRKVRSPQRTLAVVDHNVPTTDRSHGISDPESAIQVQTLADHTAEFGVEYYDEFDPRQGIVHIVGPEQGFTLPGMTIVCGDSHTSTHGAFGALAHGIGTSEVEHVLATQTLIQKKAKNMRVTVDGALHDGVTAKDIILAIIGKIGTAGGTGHVIEYAGEAIRALSMAGRMTICNMSIEGGARVGYINPDETTFEYLKGRTYAPSNAPPNGLSNGASSGGDWEKAVSWWRSMASDPDASFDDDVEIVGGEIKPAVTWGINPGQSVGVDEAIPSPGDFEGGERTSIEEALSFMDFQPGKKISGTKIDVAFIGSCTNSRISDLRAAARVVEGRKVASDVRALVVPGSRDVAQVALSEGLDKIFSDAGFDWRGAGCSMCLAMNPDKLNDREICASSSNRNFKGRQGHPTGRTLLMSPAMVAAAAVAGEVVDVREFYDDE